MNLQTLRSVALRLFGFFRKPARDRDVQDELSSHLQLHIDDNLRRGMTPEAARRDALLKLGGIEQTRELVRVQQSLPFLETLLQDTRYAFRIFKKSPAFTAVAVCTFALGIGANTATFSVSNTYFRNPLSIPNSDRVFMLLNLAPGQSEGWSGVSPADYTDLREQNHSFESIGAFDWADLNLTGVGDPLKVQGFRVSSNFFDILQVRPLLGRTFIPDEEQPGRDREAIISSGLWCRQFASDPNVVGRTVRLDGIPTQIVGVMKNNLRFPMGAEIWIPLALSQPEKVQRSEHSLSPIGRLKQGVTPDQARAEARAIQDRLVAAYPEKETGWNFQLMTVSEFVSGPGPSYTLLCLCAVGFVLLIACTNVMNLLFARSTVRQSEYAIRVALGATRSRLIRQSLVESILLGLAGMLVGLLLGSWWISLIRGNMPPEVERFIPGWSRVRLDTGVFLYTFAVSLLAGIIAGLLPAFFGSSADPNDALKESGRGHGTSVSRARLRNALVVVEIALSLILLVGAALMSRGVQSLFALNFKFNPEAVFVFRVSLPDSRFATPAQRSAFFDNLSDRLNRAPGVQSSTTAMLVPFTGGDTSSFSIEYRPLQTGDAQYATFNQVSPSFFQVFHLSVVQGREFNDSDVASSAPVAIISESLAKRFWPIGTPLGHRIKTGHDNSTDPWATIVGVVPEITYDPWRHDDPPGIYFPLRQQPLSGAYVALRSNLDAQAVLPIIRTAVSNIDPDQPIFDAMPFRRLISNSIIGLTYVAVLMGVIGLMALVLAAVGVAGVMAFSVAQRRHETGIRMALGARPQDISSMFIRNGVKLLALGLLIGLPISFALARLISSLLYGVQSSDRASFLGGPLLLILAVFLACYIPARSASRVDPATILRSE
jgi:putative ABC transport system permease protein